MLVSVTIAVTACGGSGPHSTATSPTAPSAVASAVPATGLIAFVRSPDSTRTTDALFVSNADGSNARQLTRPPADTLDDAPDWAPDGSHIVFTRCLPTYCRLLMVGADGTNLTPLTPDCGSGPLRSTCEQGNTASFSPDGRFLAYGWASGNVVTDEIEHSQVYVMNADGTGKRAVTNFAPYSGDAGDPQWSPEGKQLVFSRSNAGPTQPTGGRALFIVNVDGSGLRQLTPWALGAGGQADWSPASNLIAFRAVNDEELGIGNFYTIHPDGSSVTQVTQFTGITISYKVSFSPDGQRIIFARHDGVGPSALFTIGIDGTNLQRVGNSPESDTGPDWLPRR
jgi:Tol biopolymer transport system component